MVVDRKSRFADWTIPGQALNCDQALDSLFPPIMVSRPDAARCECDDVPPTLFFRLKMHGSCVSHVHCNAPLTFIIHCKCSFICSSAYIDSIYSSSAILQ
jgi:hypothetical protein